jgi:hypothetical protein
MFALRKNNFFLNKCGSLNDSTFNSHEWSSILILKMRASSHGAFSITKLNVDSEKKIIILTYI